MDFREAFELRAVLREGVDLVEQAGCLLGNREGVDAVRLEVAGDALDVAVEEVVEVDDLVLVDAALEGVRPMAGTSLQPKEATCISAALAS